MSKRKGNIVLRIAAFVFMGVVAVLFCTAWWLSVHYKQVIADRLPKIVTTSTDSVYHLSFKDINVSLFSHEVTITGLQLWPDEKQANALRARQHRVPITLSTVSISSLVATGITWGDLVSNRSLDCKHVAVHNLKWKMICTPHPEDSLFTKDKKSTPYIGRITAAGVDFINPEVAYHYKGTRENFDCYMSGGNVTLNKWAYNYDQTIDTSAFLYARSGKVRFESFTFSKPAGRYVVKTPDLDFESTNNSVTLRFVKIKHLVDYDQQSGKEKENFDLHFPVIELDGFNWNKLIDKGVLRIPEVYATAPVINIRYIRENNPANGRTGSYPNQLLLQVGLKTNIGKLYIKNGSFKYTEVTPKGDEGIIEFNDIHGQFENITNLPKAIERHNSCVITLVGKFMKKSNIAITFDLSLTDKKGGFTVDGHVDNLDGDEVTPQAQVFTIVKVTSFHLDRMDIHIAGDESYAKGNFTVLYKDLKISLLKFDSKMREGKKGLFAFVGSALVLYKSNPLPNKEVRTVTTSFARDTTKGFISVIWQHMYRAAKKTAVREQGIVTLTDGPETNKGDAPKKGFFKRLFGKKKGN